MNTLAILIGMVFLFCVIGGWWQGMFRVLVSVAGLIASIVIAVYIAPYVSSFIQENTKIDENLAHYISEKMKFSENGEETSKGIQVALIQELPIPETMKDNILNNNNSEMYDVLDATGVYDYISKSIAMIIVNVAGFLCIAFVCRVFFFFLGAAAKGLSKLPILHSIDKMGGVILGSIKGLILIWIFFLIISVTCTMDWSRACIKEIEQVPILETLYNNNVLVDIVGDLTKVLFM